MPILLNNAIDKVVKTFDLRSPEAIARAGGTIHGSPTFDRDGIKLNGSTDYVMYKIPNTLMACEKIKISIEFTPDFAYDVDSEKYIFSAGTEHYRVYKRNNANGNVLRVSLGNTLIGNISSANYSAYWKQNERNVLVISGTSGDTNVWLNGYLIMDSDSSSWSPTMVTSLSIGIASGGSSATAFNGKIHSLTVGNDLSTAEEAQDLYDNSTFNFQNKASGYWDFKSVIGATATTKDKSGNGDDATINGCTFLNPGLSFDAVNDYLSDLTAPSGTYTVAIHQKVSGLETVEFESDLTTWNKIITSGNFEGNLYHLAWFPFTLTPIQERQLNSQWLNDK